MLVVKLTTLPKLEQCEWLPLLEMSEVTKIVRVYFARVPKVVYNVVPFPLKRSDVFYDFFSCYSLAHKISTE